MLFFEDNEVEVVEVQKVVGHTLDSKLTWGSMVGALAAKARERLAALVRLGPMLDSKNLKAVCTMFTRSILECGCIAWVGAAGPNLNKLDNVQAPAEKMGGSEMETLGSRREAAAVAFSLKLVDGRARGPLKNFTPTVEEVIPQDTVSASVRGKQHGWLVPDWTNRVKGSESLDMYKRSFWGVLPQIWSALPQELVREGIEKGQGSNQDAPNTQCMVHCQSQNSTTN